MHTYTQGDIHTHRHPYIQGGDREIHTYIHTYRQAEKEIHTYRLTHT